MSYLQQTVCPYCGAQHDRASAVTNAGVKREPRPTDGAATLCIRCGEWCIVDDGSDGGLRKATAAEARAIANSEAGRLVTEAWRETIGRRKQQER